MPGGCSGDARPPGCPRCAPSTGPSDRSVQPWGWEQGWHVLVGEKEQKPCLMPSQTQTCGSRLGCGQKNLLLSCRCSVTAAKAGARPGEEQRLRMQACPPAQLHLHLTPRHLMVIKHLLQSENMLGRSKLKLGGHWGLPPHTHTLRKSPKARPRPADKALTAHLAPNIPQIPPKFFLPLLASL